MNKSEAVQKYWEAFCNAHPEFDRTALYQTWYFGLTREDARELAALVLEGKKTATASLPDEYENKPEDMPVVGTCSVVTDFDGDPLCVVRTTEVRSVPFNEIDAEFAFDEGEGDQSLDYWRQVHWDYFTRRLTELGRQPGETMPVICERFELL